MMQKETHLKMEFMKKFTTSKFRSILKQKLFIIWQVLIT